MKTTLETIKSYRPCEEGWHLLLKNLGTTNMDTEVTLEQILDSNGVKDAYWSLRCWDYKEYAILLANVAESVHHIYSKHYPDDNRVKDCIQGVRDYACGRIDKNQLAAAWDAASAAVSAAASAAARAAASAAARAAASAAAWDAASAAAWDAASAAASVAAWDAQWEKNEKLMREFLARIEENEG